MSEEVDNIGSNNITAVHNPVTAMCYSPDGKVLIAILGNRISIWDANSGKKLRTFLASSHQKSFVSIAYNPEKKQIAIGDSSGGISIYNEMGKWVKELPR